MNTLETHVLELIGENSSSPDVFTNTSTGLAQIRGSLNDAIEEIAMMTGGYRRTYPLSLLAGAQFYRLDFATDEFGWIAGVWYPGRKIRLEQTDITRLNRFNSRWLLNTGNPSAYWPIGFKHIGLWPRPSSSGELLEIDAVVIPKRYTSDTDRIKLRDKFEWAAVHYAVSEYWASRGDAQTAVGHFNKYLKRMGINIQYPMAQEQVRWARTEKEPWPKSTE